LIRNEIIVVPTLAVSTLM